MTRSKQQPRGVALMIVVIVVAVAAILAFALVGSQSTLVQASDNGVKAMQADALAESGVQLATYYLKNPGAAPLLNGAGYYPGQTGVSLGSDTQGTVDITVSQVSSGTYDISCTANSGTGSTLTRKVAARANVAYGYLPAESTQINGNLTIYSNTTVNGSVRSNGTVTVQVGGKVNGTIYAPSIAGSMVNVQATQTVPAGTNPVSTTVKNYMTYTYNGNSYSAQALSTNATSLGPTDTNPLAVYYIPTDQTVSKNLVLNGTLITNGKLTIATPSVTISAQSGMPALVANTDVQFSGSSRTLNVNGLGWIKGQVTKLGAIGASNAFKVNGALQFASTGAISSTYSGTVTVTYDPTSAIVPDFVAGANNATYSVKLTSFSSNGSN